MRKRDTAGQNKAQVNEINEQEGKQSAHNAHELRDDQNNTGSLNPDVETKTKLERSK